MASVWDFFFSLASSRIVGTVVNAIIVILGMAGLLQLVLATRSLGAAQGELDEITPKLRSKEATPDRILALGRAIPQRSLLSRRIETLGTLHTNGAEVDSAAFAASAVAELDGAATLARWASSNVVLLGLAGTLLGLSMAVVNAMPFLKDIASAPQATEAVLNTFDGLHTAFSTTLMGIVWGIILGLALMWFRSRQQRFLQQLENISHTYLYPRFRTSPALAMVDAARTLAALEESIGKELTELVGAVRTQGLALTKTVEDSMRGLIEQFADTAAGVRQSTTDALGGIVLETRERGLALVSTIDRSFTTLTEEVRASHADVMERVVVITESIEKLIGMPGPEAQPLSMLLAQLEQGVQSMNRSAERMTQLAPALEESIARQVDRQSRDLHEAINTYTGRLNASLDRQDALITTGLERVQEGVAGFGDTMLSRMQAHDTELLDGVGKKLEPVAGLLDQQVGHLREMRLIAEGLSAAAAGLDRRGEDIGRAMGEARHSAGGLAHQLEQLGRSMESLSSALQRVAGTPSHLVPTFPGPLVPTGPANLAGQPPPPTPHPRVDLNPPAPRRRPETVGPDVPKSVPVPRGPSRADPVDRPRPPLPAEPPPLPSRTGTSPGEGGPPSTPAPPAPPTVPPAERQTSPHTMGGAGSTDGAPTSDRRKRGFIRRLLGWK